MNTASTWTTDWATSRANEQLSVARRAIALGLLIISVTIGIGAWMYLEGAGELRSYAASVTASGEIAQEHLSLLRHLERWFLWLVIVMSAGGTTFVAAVVSGLALWRHVAARGFSGRIEQMHRTVTALQAQLVESRKAEEGFHKLRGKWDERVSSLERSNRALQDELNARWRVEKALSQRRQELESSNNVLELHVQARTLELQTLQRRNELILESAGEGICGLDLDEKIVFANPAAARITGWEIEEIIGSPEHQIFGRNGSEEREALESGKAREQVFSRKNGASVSVEFLKTPIQENGSRLGAVLIFKDITERKRAEERLAQKAAELARSNAELEQFAFVASHDLQEPLRKIQAFGDRLKARCQSAPPEAHDYLERMQNAAARMQTLINDLLAFSRVIRSSQPFVPVDLAALTEDVLGDLEVRIEKTGAKVIVGKLPAIEADPMQMRQLVQNLVSNALKFQPPNATPEVRISARIFEQPDAVPSAEGINGAHAAERQVCELTFQDNGIGFDEKYVDRIFAVFQRLHGRSEYEGTGVGLAVCRRIADRHNGAIVAKSEPGQGATFIVTLPVRQMKGEK
jgi:PAS domain S-box-containing protein